MAIEHATSGEVIEVQSLPTEIPPIGLQLTTLVKTPSLEVKRLLLARGREIPPHHAPGEITVHCLSGRVTFRANDVPVELAGGQMLFLSPGVTHSLVGLEDSTLLVTKLASALPPPTLA